MIVGTPTEICLSPSAPWDPLEPLGGSMQPASDTVNSELRKAANKARLRCVMGILATFARL
ncbi:hypothetical protein GCM10010429_09630 [Micromonospora olivasterospora]